MIKANELRVGNLVKLGKKIGQVRQIIYCANKKEIDVANEESYMDSFAACLDPKEFSPIPLTPEILIACGFERYYNPERDHRTEWWNFGNISLRVYDAKVWFETNSPILTMTINSLHQLQNLIFALTGEELNYKPLKL